MARPECPYMVKRGGYSEELDEYLYDVMCDLVDKYCLIEHGDGTCCETYNDFLREQIKEAEK